MELLLKDNRNVNKIRRFADCEQERCTRFVFYYLITCYLYLVANFINFINKFFELADVLLITYLFDFLLVFERKWFRSKSHIMYQRLSYYLTHGWDFIPLEWICMYS